MARDPKFRKAMITQNNPQEIGLDHARIDEVLREFKSLEYYCLADEVGSTHHTHIFALFSSPVRFSTLKNSFPKARIEKARGKAKQCRDYIAKIGKWEKDKKSETSIPGTFKEFGTLPLERPGARNDLLEIKDRLKEKATIADILEEFPEQMMNIDRIERVRQVIQADLYKDTFRNLTVIYLHGLTGTGKTSYVLKKHGYRNVYRVSNYKHPFDGYQGEDVMFFDEFNSQLSIEEMLNYLDGYPLALPCRYANKQACYTTVYIASNMPLYTQYPEAKEKRRPVWKAFLRRIEEVLEFPLASTSTPSTPESIALVKELFDIKD